MKRLIATMGIIIYAIITHAQTNYYGSTKTFVEDGYTYQCDVRPSGYAILYNKNNKWTYVHQMKKGTDKPFYITPENYQPVVKADKNEAYIDSIYKVIVNNAFKEYKTKVKGSAFYIVTCTDTDTGKIAEVCFHVPTFTPYVTIPVSVFREIECNLVGLQYTLTELGKTLNYLYLFWRIEPE